MPIGPDIRNVCVNWEANVTNVDLVRVRVLPDGRLTREDAAAFLGRKAKTLAEWHRLGVGPRSMMVGGRRFYRLTDLEAFVSLSAMGHG